MGWCARVALRARMLACKGGCGNKFALMQCAALQAFTLPSMLHAQRFP